MGSNRQKGYMYHSKFKDKEAHVSFYLQLLIDKSGTCIILLVGSQEKKGHIYHSKFKVKGAHVSFYVWFSRQRRVERLGN